MVYLICRKHKFFPRICYWGSSSLSSYNLYSDNTDGYFSFFCLSFVGTVFVCFSLQYDIWWWKGSFGKVRLKQDIFKELQDRCYTPICKKE